MYKMEEEFNYDEELEDNDVETKSPSVASKTPAYKGTNGDNISIYFTSTIGPGEKKQSLLVNTGNRISALKQTVGNMYGLEPNDFHLSHGGVTLEESYPLNNYAVEDKDTVLLIPASTAGK